MRRIAALTRNPVDHRAGHGAGDRRLRLEEDAEQRRRSRPRRGAATPGSAQDFTVNVGDRIFFDTDSLGDPRRRAEALSTARRSG